MKFKIGDKVRACGARDKREVGTIIRIDESNPEFNPPYETSFGWKYEHNLELIKPGVFKIGDKVTSVFGAFTGQTGEIVEVDISPTNADVPYKVEFSEGFHWKCESNLELFEPAEEAPPRYDVVSDIRTFETGATRDTTVGKLSYMKALSPEVLEAYVMYLDKHRLQSDGSMREFDNWKKGIDKWIYLDSLLRHDKAVWKLMLGYDVSDNRGPATLLDSLMAVIFNATGLAYELLIEEGKARRCVQSS